MKCNRLKIFSCILLLSASFAHSQSSSLSNTSSTTLRTRWQRFVEGMEINYKNLYGYSAQTEEESEFEGKIDYDEAPTGRMLNELAIGYKLSENSVASIVGVWSIMPNNLDEEVKTFEPLDPYLKVSFDSVIERRNFEYSTDLRIGVPVSRESREANKVLSIGSEQEIEFQFGKTRWSTELELYLQYNVHRSISEYEDLELRYEPAILYELSQNTYGRLAYESAMRHERHDKLRLIDNREPAIQIGCGWFASKALEIYPFVDVNLTEPGVKNALYGALISWSLL